VLGAYRYSQEKDESGGPVTFMKVRALMAPPGVPDFLTRTRLVEAGAVPLSGRAWAGRTGISRVEVSTDRWFFMVGCATGGGGLALRMARVVLRLGSLPGNYTLCVRATDTEGNARPVTQTWNYHGVGNNMVQRVDVVVE